MRGWVIVAVAAIIAASWRALPAQGNVALTGVVTSAEEGKMEGVVVNARRAGANFTVSVVSDGQGRYSFPRTHLEPGQYTVTIRATGFDLVAPGPKTSVAKFWPTPTPDSFPRRGQMDEHDRFWFAENRASKLGVFNTRTEKFQEWALPYENTHPYASSSIDKKGRVYLASNMLERVSRVDTKTGEVVEYVIPTEF